MTTIPQRRGVSAPDSSSFFIFRLYSASKFFLFLVRYLARSLSLSLSLSLSVFLFCSFFIYQKFNLLLLTEKWLAETLFCRMAFSAESNF